MANKENCPPTPPSASSIAVGLRPWHTTAFASPPLRAISPNSKPVLSRQRDHSACGRPETPLKVRKTRENLRANLGYPDIPPPCVYGMDSCTGVVPETLRVPIKPVVYYSQQDTPMSAAASPPAVRPLLKAERHKSVSQRMLSKVRQGMNNRSKASLSVRDAENEPNLIRRLSGRRKHSSDNERRVQSFEICRNSVGSIEGCDLDVPPVAALSTRRSMSDSTLSTSELMIGCPSTPRKHDYCRPSTDTAHTDESSSPRHGRARSCDETPRPCSSKLTRITQTRTSVPSVSLKVTLEQPTIDCDLQADIWIAIEASVQAYRQPITPDEDGVHSTMAHDDSLNCVTECISSLRICYKALPSCTILEVIGHKSLKDLKMGQKCSLFIKVRIKEVPRCIPTDHDDQKSLFTELESLVGTLTTEILQIELRYRTTMLPYDNVVTVKHVAKVIRPRTDSRWSIIGTYTDIEMSEQTHTKLAIYIADTYPPERALRYLDRCLATELEREEPLRQIRKTIAAELVDRLDEAVPKIDRVCPTVVVTADESKSSTRAQPSTPSSSPSHISGLPALDYYDNSTHDSRPVPGSAMSNPVLSTGSPLQTPQSTLLMSATSIDMSTLLNDDARQVWNHIRRSSQSTNQLTSNSEDQIEYLEASDERLKSLRDKALANKRSVGAETLKGWKWDGEMMKLGEAPWL